MRRPTKLIKSGFRFEKELFGFSDESLLFSRMLPYDEALQRVIDIPLITKTETGEIETYNPFNPSVRWGRSGDILRAVKKRLTKRFKRKRIPPPALYLAGGTTLDSQWKIDAFIKWNDVIVTIDASTRLKSRDPMDLAWGALLLENADVVLLPKDVSNKESLGDFGTRVAKILNKKGREKRLKEFYDSLSLKEQKGLQKGDIQISDLED